LDHPITKGRNETEKINSVATFLGTAFKAGDDFQPLMILEPGFELYTPKNKGDFTKGISKIPIGGWLQGGIEEYGEGRLAFFAEAGMFTAQMFGKDKVIGGMNHPKAKENAQYVLNLFHWLSNSL
jgi:hypothetical protein